MAGNDRNGRPEPAFYATPPIVDTDDEPSAAAALPPVTAPPLPPFDTRYNGVNYVADVYGSYAAADSLPQLVADHGNAIAAVADFGIDAENSTVYDNDIPGGYTESDAHIAAAIQTAVSLGLNVMVRPLLDFLPSNYETAPGQTNPLNGGYPAGDFRSYYNPANPAAFFASYQTMIVDQARLAQASGATLFCVGTELDQLTGPAYERDWDSIITAVRAVFSGKLTYSADWDDALSPWQYGGSGLGAGTGNIATQVSFWQKLDYIGVDEYAPISDLADPTLAQLIAGWTQAPTDPYARAVTGGQSLISYYQGLSATLHLPLLFTELGYANASDAASSPATPGYDENGNPDGAVADPSLQAKLYQAFFDAWAQSGNDSLAGTFFWNWEPTGDTNNSQFSPQGLPAEAALDTGFAACYAAGTHIETPVGPVPIERLAVGQLVCTAAGEAVPIRWIGRRVINLAGHPEPELVRPIRFSPGALADGVPARTLVVSPDHGMLVEGVLVAARLLVNHVSIFQDTAATQVTYLHLELDRHAILFAEGAPAESYFDTGNRAMFANAATALARDGDRPPCRERVSDAACVFPIWERLAAAAGGVPAPDDPTACVELTLFADGRCLRPVFTADLQAIFALPRATRSLRLVSAADRPSRRHPWLDDRRLLGVAVRRARADGAELPLDGPAFGDGWWEIEQGFRWSNGNGALAPPPDAALLTLDLHAVPGAAYSAAQPASAAG